MKIILTYLLAFFTSFSFAQKQFEVFFDFNKDVPNEKSADYLNSFLSSNSEIEIVAISGYCDSIDSNSYNKKLATRRINSVMELLQKKAILINDNLKVTAFGEDFQLSKIQAENRKVIFEFKETQEHIIENELEEMPELVSVKESKVVIKSSKPVKLDKVELERISLAEQFEKAKIGERIAIYNINFLFNSEELDLRSKPLLEELLFIMERNPKMVIKIHGHICCNPNPYNTKLSYRRALKIFKYLRDKGISQNRLDYNGVGSNNPIYPIPEKTEDERIANRRVEIEIVRK